MGSHIHGLLPVVRHPSKHFINTNSFDLHGSSILQMQFCCHLTEEETEAQKGEAIQSQGLDPGGLAPAKDQYSSASSDKETCLV